MGITGVEVLVINIGSLHMDIDYTYIEIGEITEPMFDWLNSSNSGKGHFGLGGHGVYFELAEDATWFAMKWS